MRNVMVLFSTAILLSSFTSAQNFWQQTNGPSMGYVYSLQPNSSGHLFAGTGAGVFRSTDNGDSWIPINEGLTRLEITCLAVDLNGYVYAGTDDAGIFRSTNDGDNWTPIGMSSIWVISLTIKSNGDIFAGTQSDGVFRSVDNGANWIKVGLPDIGVRSFVINSTGHIYAGTTGSGMFRSTDNGDNWNAINTGLTDDFVWSLVINSNGHMFAGTYEGGVFRSTDNGNSWTAQGLENTWVLSQAINSSGHVYAGTYYGGAFRSTDNGDNWTQINTGLTNPLVWSLAINPSGRIYAGTAGGGVYRSIGSTTAVRESDEGKPSSFVLRQNYPNPFSPYTTIIYSLPKSDFVTMYIYDHSGKKIETILSSYQAAGEHQVRWMAADYPSGVYFCRLQAGELSVTRKLLVRK